MISLNKRTFEEQQLAKNLQLIHNEEKILKELKSDTENALIDAAKENGTSENKINAFSDESSRDSYINRRQHEIDLLVRYQSLETQEKRQSVLKIMEKNPYFARIDFIEDHEDGSLYVGVASLRDDRDEPIVVDWRSPIANLYYESELGPTYYESLGEKINVVLTLKRQFKITNGKLISLVDTSETIHDDFLLEILDETSNNHMKNIVATIQKTQNAIIRNTTSQVMMIEGIAGSGKTSALLQRVAYLLYTHRNWLDPKQVLLFSPNHLFSEYIAEVLPSLGENQIPTATFMSYFQQLLPDYHVVKRSQLENDFLAGKKSSASQLKASFDLVGLMTSYLEKIQAVGPLFNDLKIRGEVKISKQQIRQYYQDANPLLPIHQRLALLQTKLSKKLGGLLKDEQKKQWVRDAVQEKMDELYSGNYALNDDGQNENKLRRDFSQKIVRHYFKKIKRQINNFTFIAFPKQYVHFLSLVPETLYTQFGFTPESFQDELDQIKARFKENTILQEDAALFLLLMRNMMPLYIGQKARFIFIDEMQDVTPIEAVLLRELHPEANFTFCGDLNQQIFGNPTLVTELVDIFPERRIQNYQLTTSYRSTAEIMAFAESFLHNPMATDAPRHGTQPTLVFQKELAGLRDALITATRAPHSNQIERQAIITKSTAEAIALAESLADSGLDFQLITDENDFFKRSLVILPAFLAKGLEFDEVFLFNISDTTYTNESDRLLLYTMITRGMHHVSCFILGEKLPFNVATPA